ncbi:MAG: lytic transglycosylase domain-containing protein [Pseudomonadota bacterium]
MDPKGPGAQERYAQALDLIRDRRASGQAIISVDRVAYISERWRDQISEAARKHQISEILILAVITAESRGKPKAKSPKGAQGLMQLIPATARRFGVTDSYDPAQNIDGGSAYLAWLLDRFQEDVLLTLAGYNAGENAVAKHDGVPPYRETRDYIPIVFDAIAAAETLCLVAPEGPRRACLWRDGAGS